MAIRNRRISASFFSLKAIVLFVFWVLLSGSFEWIHLGLGLIISIFVAWNNSGHSRFIPTFRLWFRVILYLPWLFYKIVQSSLHLSKLILHPALPIDPQLISVESKLNHQAAVVLFGNSLTLTPGTITVEVDKNKLTFHALDKALGDDVASKQMESKIAKIFRGEEPDL